MCLCTLVQMQVLVSECWRLLLKVPAAGTVVSVYTATQAFQTCTDAVTLVACSEVSAPEYVYLLC